MHFKICGLVGGDKQNLHYKGRIQYKLLKKVTLSYAQCSFGRVKIVTFKHDTMMKTGQDIGDSLLTLNNQQINQPLKIDCSVFPFK